MEEKKYISLNDVKAYKIAFHLSNYVWDIVVKWNHFAQNTIGRQFVDAADSISANIAEGFGRYHKKDKIKFYRSKTNHLTIQPSNYSTIQPSAMNECPD
jgi:hypothetical protein